MGNYKEKDIKRLITASGGRCCFRDGNDVCKMLLVSYGTQFGNIAHIAARNEGGPRYDPLQSDEERNSYDNLMWMCPTHHTIIDKRDNWDFFTADVLHQMKREHEEDIKRGNYSVNQLYDPIVSDYAALSTLFQFVDINKLYSYSLTLPDKVHGDFYNIAGMVSAYEEGNGPFHLYDIHLHNLFKRFMESLRLLKRSIEFINYEPIIDADELGWLQATGGNWEEGMGKYWISYYQRCTEDFTGAVRNRYPDILTQSLWES
ncbi:Uncharacterised protein [Vibrio owensii]|uniref:HNH endonuclease signature motif containing protein n=1 Tax=Vibrio owensii TaxID=696485 RepID=UPI0003A5ED6E|nr:HNH endonuclease signature motif containing protein [Vibrio owensii]SUP37456.1 Uncharacterised protein [Vibrio owensii]